MKPTALKSNQTASLGKSRRDFLKKSGGAVLALPAMASLADGRPRTRTIPRPDRPKNILFLMTDQQHADTISGLGCSHVHTPHLDRLARLGTSFSHSYCPYPVCVPSRAATFSGRPASEVLEDRRIDPAFPNLGQWFSDKSETDYETIYCGKWHLPQTYTPRIDGFRVLTSGLAGMGYIGDPVISRACEGYLRNTPASRSFLMVASFMQAHDICEWLRLNTENPGRLPHQALADHLPPLPENFHFDPVEPTWVRQYRTRNEPFYGDRHGDPKGRWDEWQWRYYLWSYYRHIEQVDSEIGRILEALEETGRADDTLIVFTSDHGEGLAHHQMVRKGTTYDESARVPLVFAWPGRIPSHRVDSSLASGLDIFPTLCDYAGIPGPPVARGRSLRGVLERRESIDRECVVIENHGNRGRALRSQDFKYIVYHHDRVEQLFDLRDDPGERVNLAHEARCAGLLREHREMLKRWEISLQPHPSCGHRDAWWYGGGGDAPQDPA
jgi:choline-sulfatase